MRGIEPCSQSPGDVVLFVERHKLHVVEIVGISWLIVQLLNAIMANVNAKIKKSNLSN